MFNNIGGKIQVLAIVVCCIGIFCSIITALTLFIDEEIGAGFGYLILGPVISWTSSFVLYGFGQLIETTENIEYYLLNKSEESHLLAKTLEKNIVNNDFWVCGVCGRKNRPAAPYCNGCGNKK